MAVSIRLARQGSKQRPFYRIVAADRRRSRDGRFIEQLGYYDPRSNSFSLNKESYDRWISNGAIASDTVASLVRRDVRTSV